MITKFRPGRCVIDSDIYQAAVFVCAALKSHHFDAYMVGGCVRDFILFPKNTPKDIDLATNANTEEILKIFPNTVRVGNSFGVCLVKYGRFTFELATFRKDGPYLDRRHPSYVTAGNLEEDSCRRDFTINALYFSPVTSELVDIHGGASDLKKRVIRSVGFADDRIYEDALRILRALRFSANFKFKLSSSVTRAIQRHADGLNEISQERILNEISKVCFLVEFVEMFVKYLNISLFFKNLKQKSKEDIKAIKLTTKLLHKCKISPRSNFFDFFVVLLKYYKIINLIELNNEIKLLRCSHYDKKLCLWFVNLLAPSEPFEFFKNLVKIERIEPELNLEFFRILKTLNPNKIHVRILNTYGTKKP